MRRFAELYARLDGTNKTNEKVAALRQYFTTVEPADAAWTLYFLLGRKPRQAVAARKLAAWACELAGTPAWLFDESYDAVGDLGETIALLLPPPIASSQTTLAAWVEERLLKLRGMPEPEQRELVCRSWQESDVVQRFVWNKLITGGFRVGVAQGLVIRALAEAAALTTNVIAQRLTGDWTPTPAFYKSLIDSAESPKDVGRPLPFCLAHPLEAPPETLGDPAEWQAEWKWDGIRAQLIVDQSRIVLWSRGEELITERFPELQEIGRLLADHTVLDGEILPWKAGAVLPFAQLQRRIGRKNVGKKLLEDVPVVLMAYDLLAEKGEDLREKPLAHRRERLERLAERLGETERFHLSPAIGFVDWTDLARQRAESRDRRVEGVMLKRKTSPYRVGRVRGDWWKWKIEPMTVDAVLIMAQRGHGKRASLYSDYTFGIWKSGELVPFAKAYSGLTDEEIRKVDAFVRGHTRERFGPVRAVEPKLVFELGFEGIQRSTRHKSGVAVRFPRMLRWRDDKRPEDADSLETVLAMLGAPA